MALTILLVEDEAILALNEKCTIEQAGYRVVHCLTGEKAIEIVKADETISLILMDIDLGRGMDGTRAAVEILRIKDVPIVFLTSHSEKQMVDKVKNITKYGYVIKATGQFVLIEAINTALELFNAHSALKKSEIEYREIVEGIDSAILKFDDEGRIIFFNRGAEKIFGYRSEEVLGKRGVETINPLTDAGGCSHEELLQNIFKNPEAYSINENENRTKDGSRLWMRWFNKAVYDHNGVKMYILGIGTDLTESRTLQG